MSIFEKDKGSIGELLGTTICMLALLSLILVFFRNMEQIQCKASASQIARKYMLQMECVGCLEETTEQSMIAELEKLGLSSISTEGTSKVKAPYGADITLHFEGYLQGGIRLEETRMSTAKN